MARRLKGASSADTRSAILDLIRSNGQISRTQLAEKSGLTESTISKVVRGLIDRELVVEGGHAVSTGGKRPVLLELNPSSRWAVGLSLDFARISIVLCDIFGAVVHSDILQGAGDETPMSVVNRVSQDLARFLARHDVDSRDVIGIGVSDAGRIDASGQSLRSSRQASGWEDFDVEAALGECTGLPVKLENDANCAALGEFWSGRIPVGDDFVTIYMASGIGSGFMVHGDVYRGASSNAGEIGHLSLNVDGPPCACGSRGCLEVLATPAVVVADARATPALWQRIVDRGEPDSTRTAFSAIATLAVEGDVDALALIRRSARYLATAVLGLTNVLDLDRVVLAGPGFAIAGEIYLETVRDTLDRLAFMRAVHPVTVHMGDTGPQTAARGAASVVLHSHLTPHYVRG